MRKSLTKKVRFEIFKRDSFKCQYCGDSAPDAILEVDHIKPVSEGGSNDITNLITSCRDCNRGKSNRLLDDKSMVHKQRKQLEELNERRLQLELMVEWREGLLKLEDEKVQVLCEKFYDLTDGQYNRTDSGKRALRALLKKFDINIILDAMEAAAPQYLEYKNGVIVGESVDLFDEMVPRICTNKVREKERPYLKDLYYIWGIARNRFHYVDKKDTIKLLEDAYLSGAPIDALKEFAERVKDRNEFCEGLEIFIEHQGSENHESP